VSREVVGRITIVQEDRIRLVDDEERGYLLTVKHNRASLADLERWRDRGTRLRVRFTGVPDAGAVAERVAPVPSRRPRGDGMPRT
jgi:hypothetical protein